MKFAVMNKMFTKSLSSAAIFMVYQNSDVKNMLSSTDNIIFTLVGSLFSLSTSFIKMKPGMKAQKAPTTMNRIQFVAGMASQSSK